MSRHLMPLMLAAALAACGEEGLRAPVSGPPARVYSGDAGPEPGGPVTSVASKPSFEMDAPPLAEVGNLCTYRPRKEPVMSGFADRSGAAWEGEIRVKDLASLDPKWFGPSDKRVATVVARPRVDVYRARIDDNCYDAVRKVYYGCSKVLEADLSKIRGFARALTVERARRLAIQLCEKKVDEVLEKSVEIRQDNYDRRCRVIEQAYCELPPAPPPPPAKKKP